MNPTCSVVKCAPGTGELLRVLCAIGAVEALRADVGGVGDNGAKRGIAVEALLTGVAVPFTNGVL